MLTGAAFTTAGAAGRWGCMSGPVSQGAIQAASDSFLRQAVYAVCTVEAQPTLWDVYRMLGIGESKYRTNIVARLQHADAPFARGYWQREFPALISDKGYAALALHPAQQDRAPDFHTRDRHAAPPSRPA